jgi:hypothetical protein
MKTATGTVWPLVMKALDFEEDADMMAMHVGEFEEEAENVLQLLTIMRAAARQEDTAGTQDTAAELVIALEHLSHHLNELLPALRARLDLEP